MSKPTLFRRESEQARSTAWLGRVVLIRPISFAFLTAIALGMALALAAFFVFGEYTRKARVAGILAPSHGIMRIVAQQSGIVESVSVREGDAVARDAALFVIGDGRANRRSEDVGSAVAARLAQRRRALQRQREHAAAAVAVERAALGQRIAGISRELRLIDSELAAQSERASLSDASLERARRLEAIGFLSAAALDRERDIALDQGQRQEAMKRARLALDRELSAARFEVDAATARADAQLASIDIQAASLEQEALERELQYKASIVAPAEGTVAAVLVEPGQTVVAGMALATVLPADGVLEAHLYAPSRSIGFVRTGQEVLLRYLAYPHQKFGSHAARVVAVSRNPLAPGELGYTPADGSREPVYRIKAALGSQAVAAYGRGEPLQPGLQVEADILLDRRRLIEWIFEPLLGLAGRT